MTEPRKPGPRTRPPKPARGPKPAPPAGPALVGPDGAAVPADGAVAVPAAGAAPPPVVDWTAVPKEKKKREAAAAARANLRGVADKFITAVLDSSARKFGGFGTVVGKDADNLFVVVPVPALVFEILIGLSGFPLSSVIQLVAEPKVGKSALLAEFGRWFFGLDGAFFLEECETKFNPGWYRSILGPRLFDERTLYHPCADLEAWQDGVTHNIKRAQDVMVGTPDAPGPGRVLPVLGGVDSILGKSSRETQEKIVGAALADGRRSSSGSKGGEGHAERAHPIEAMKVTGYLRTIPALLQRWPISLVLINHLKMSRDPNDPAKLVRAKPGGAHLTFQQHVELELARVGPRFRNPRFDGYAVKIKTAFNSFAPADRQITTRLVWWRADDPETGARRQFTCWDWDWSLVHTLDNFLNNPEYCPDPAVRARLRDLGVHVEVTSRGDIENAAWSKTVGVKKDDAVGWAQLGAMLRGDPAVVAKIRDAFGVDTRPVLSGSLEKQVDRLQMGLA